MGMIKLAALVFVIALGVIGVHYVNKTLQRIANAPLIVPAVTQPVPKVAQQPQWVPLDQYGVQQ